MFNTKVINLFGGPGSGKSTTAAALFAALKRQGIITELVTEFAKDLTWERMYDQRSDQMWVTANQNHRLRRLMGQVEYVVTDSPLLLGIFYVNEETQEKVPSLRSTIEEMYYTYDNLPFILNRVKPYVAHGRDQTHAQAVEIDRRVREYLNRTPYGGAAKVIEVDGDHNAHDVILGHVLAQR